MIIKDRTRFTRDSIVQEYEAIVLARADIEANRCLMKSNFSGDRIGRAISTLHTSCCYCFLPRLAVAGCALHLLLLTTQAVVPEHRVHDNGVHLQGVGPDNPIIYDNDWWFDVFDNNYLWAQASLGHADLRGNIVTRDMWDWEKGYLYPM